MRLFIAILLEPAVKQALLRAQDDLKADGMKGNYTAEQNLHLTLAFIGDRPDPNMVLDVMKTVVFPPFDIQLDGFGRFENIWWAGIKESQPLESVVKRLREALADAEIPFDGRPFIPHITLLRKAQSERGPQLCLDKVGMTVHSISLMCSEQGGYGQVYTELGRVEAG